VQMFACEMRMFQDANERGNVHAVKAGCS